MKRFAMVAVVGVVISAFLSAPAAAQAPQLPSPDSQCLTCHDGIEPIRQADSLMMRRIIALGSDEGDPAGCTVCHGGDPRETEKEAAHGSSGFFPDPGSSWIAAKTCGRCHQKHVASQKTSLMMTEAGKIQGVAWAFGAMHLKYGAESAYHHLWGNYDVKNPANPKARLGTDAYRDYMKKLTSKESQVFVDQLLALPEAPGEDELEKLIEQPELAAFTYLRNQCLRCHHGVKGRYKRGDYRGMGCSSCHIPYGNEGRYEGADESISTTEPGHPLVHSIQSSRKTKVTVVHKQEVTGEDGQKKIEEKEITYSGIPVETCTTCHDRGKRIGVSFQGLMESPYEAPFTDGGGHQPKLHTKHYMAMHQDVHYQKGMACQDCHTSIDVHGDGFLATANLGAVQIECSDCHGTPDAYPWELPLGFGDEFDDSLLSEGPRRTADELTSHLKQGTIYDPEDGYLRTARGNPFSNVVRRGNRVVVHTAGGADITLEPLKFIEEDGAFSTAGQVAMKQIGAHVAGMECYTCHTSWTPQCYGCHVKIDYSANGIPGPSGATNWEPRKSFDYLASGAKFEARPEVSGLRGESLLAAEFPDLMIPGQIEEQRSHTRWDHPALGINGERRVTPVAPGCQVSVTVVLPGDKPGGDKKTVLLNHIFGAAAGTERPDKDVLSLDMSPTQPHTTTSTPRSCESCHLSEKALGHGIGGAANLRPPSDGLTVDLETAAIDEGGNHQLLSQNAQRQREPIAGLDDDWSRFVTPEGEQLQTVGHHFKHSRALNEQEQLHISREGVCLSCHEEIPDGSLAVSFLHHVGEYMGQIPKNPHEHNELIHKVVLMSAWVQFLVALGAPLVGLAIAIGGVWYYRRRRKAKGAAETPTD